MCTQQINKVLKCIKLCLTFNKFIRIDLPDYFQQRLPIPYCNKILLIVVYFGIHHVTLNF